MSEINPQFGQSLIQLIVKPLVEHSMPYVYGNIVILEYSGYI